MRFGSEDQRGNKLANSWETHVKSRGVAGWEPPIVCAKLLLDAPVCLDCVFGSPGAPFTGPPNAQLVLLPLRNQPDQRTADRRQRTNLTLCSVIYRRQEAYCDFVGLAALRILESAKVEEQDLC